MGKIKPDLVDTNLIIRFITQDSKTQAEIAEKIFKTSPPRSLLVPDIVFAETIYVLLSVYELSKEKAIEIAEKILLFPKFTFESKLSLLKALEIWKKNKISFVDAFLLAKQTALKCKLYTFDKRLAKLSLKPAKIA